MPGPRHTRGVFLSLGGWLLIHPFHLMAWDTHSLSLGSNHRDLILPLSLSPPLGAVACSQSLPQASSPSSSATLKPCPPEAFSSFLHYQPPLLSYIITSAQKHPDNSYLAKASSRAQWLRVLTELAEDQSLFPTPTPGISWQVAPDLRDLVPSSGPCGHLYYMCA